MKEYMNKTWMDTQYTRPVATKDEYLSKINTLIFHEEGIERKGSNTALNVLLNKREQIKAILNRN